MRLPSSRTGPIDYETEYNNPRRVPENAEIGARWKAASDAARRDLEAEFDVSYGPAERHRYDLFLAKGSSRDTPLAVYIHGGVWQRGDCKEYSFVVPELVARGVDVALPSYNLCPGTTVAAIFDEIRSFLRALWRKTGRRAVVVGHSVGGTMAAAMLATDWSQYDDVPDDLVRVAYAISGVFDVEPYVHTSYNVALGLTAEAARDVSPALWQPPPRGRILVAAVGGAESDEFVRQSIDITALWSDAGVTVECVIVPGANHFTVVDELTRANSGMLVRVDQLARILAANG
jgi:arylformamidase